MSKIIRFWPALIVLGVVAWIFWPSTGVGIPPAGTPLYASEVEAGNSGTSPAAVSLIMPSDVSEDMLVVLPTATSGVYSVRITGTAYAGQYFWYNPAAVVETDAGDGFNVQDTLSGFGAEEFPPIPVLPMLMAAVLFFIVFRPIRRLLIRRQAPDSINAVATKVYTSDGFEIPEIDGEMTYRRATEADAAQMFNQLGRSEVERLAAEQLKAVMRRVVQDARLADVSAALTNACRAISNGQKLPGMEMDFYSDLGIRPMAFYVTGVDFSVTQEQILQAKAEATSRGEFFALLAEAAGVSVSTVMQWDAIKENKGGLLLQMALPAEVTGEN